MPLAEASQGKEGERPFAANVRPNEAVLQAQWRDLAL